MPKWPAPGPYHRRRGSVGEANWFAPPPVSPRRNRGRCRDHCHALDRSSPSTVAAQRTVAQQTEHLRGIQPRPLDPGLRFVLFVGSAHPPNATGFMTMVAPALPALRTDERIVVAGGVCQLLAPRLEPSGPGYPPWVRDRIVLFGQVSDFTLSCLLDNASGFCFRDHLWWRVEI